MLLPLVLLQAPQGQVGVHAVPGDGLKPQVAACTGGRRRRRAGAREG